jgi:hypothetical protein
MPPPTLTPEKIPMGTFYNGARVRIEGTAPGDSGVLIVIRGAEKDEFFNRKGRVGPLWLNADRIHIKQAPSIFMSFGSTNASSLLDRASLDQYQLDETAIINRLRCKSHCKCSLTDRAQQSCKRGTEPDPAYAKLLRADFLNLKRQEGSYSARSGGVALTTAANSGTKYVLEFEWPRKVPPGDYQVEVYACREHKVVARSAKTLQLVEVGFPAYMAKLASDAPWAYGAGAVFAAMLAGFGADALTTRLRRRRRRLPAEIDAPVPEAPDVEPELTSDEVRETEMTHRD